MCVGEMHPAAALPPSPLALRPRRITRSPITEALYDDIKRAPKNSKPRRPDGQRRRRDEAEQERSNWPIGLREGEREGFFSFLVRRPRPSVISLFWRSACARAAPLSLARSRRPQREEEEEEGTKKTRPPARSTSPRTKRSQIRRQSLAGRPTATAQEREGLIRPMIEMPSPLPRCARGGSAALHCGCGIWAHAQRIIGLRKPCQKFR